METNDAIYQAVLEGRYSVPKSISDNYNSNEITFIQINLQYLRNKKSILRKISEKLDNNLEILACDYRKFTALKKHFENRASRDEFISHLKQTPTSWGYPRSGKASEVTDSIQFLWIVTLFILHDNNSNLFINFLYSDLENKKKLLNIAMYENLEKMGRYTKEKLLVELDKDGFNYMMENMGWICSDFYELNNENKLLLVLYLTYVYHEQYGFIVPLKEHSFQSIVTIPEKGVTRSEMYEEVPILFDKNAFVDREMIGIPIACEKKDGHLMKFILYVACNNRLTIEDILSKVPKEKVETILTCGQFVLIEGKNVYYPSITINEWCQRLHSEEKKYPAISLTRTLMHKYNEWNPKLEAYFSRKPIPSIPDECFLGF